MNDADITMSQIADLASAIYTDNGVAIWLGAKNHVLGARPIHLCRNHTGRVRVWELLNSMANGSFA